MNKKYCAGCRNDFYNGRNAIGVKECWSFKTAKVVWRICILNWEKPPYKNKKKVRVANCWHEVTGNSRHYVDPSRINSKGYWV